MERDDPRDEPPAAGAAELHQALVDGLVRDGALHSAAVEAAFRVVPRHPFLPGVPLERVYLDEAIVTHEQDGVPISSSSQPAIMAIMLEQLDVRPGQRVLEIGAGTGYNAALLAELVGPTGRVVTVDFDEAIVGEARANLAGAGFREVDVVQGDGGLGFPADAPYDRILLTVGAWDVAPAWVDQLAPNGRLVLPLWLRGAQLSVALEPAIDEAGLSHLRSRGAHGCGFMRLRGDFAGPEAYLPLGPDGEVTLAVDDASVVDAERVWGLLNGPSADQPLPPVGTGFWFWLAISRAGYCLLSASGEVRSPAARALPPVGSDYRAAAGLLAADALCLLLPRPSDSAAPPAELTSRLLRCHAPASTPVDALVGQIYQELERWQNASEPAIADVRLRIYPIAGADPHPPPATLLTKRWSRIAIDWDDESPGVETPG